MTGFLKIQKLNVNGRRVSLTQIIGLLLSL